MDIFAYNYGLGTYVELGCLADSIWTNGFKFSEDRELQFSKPMNASAPNIFDRVLSVENFQFAASRSFGGAGGGSLPIAAALQFVRQHSQSVPRIADLQFKQQGGEFWVRYCGISRVELVKKDSALVTFAYTIKGGTFADTRN
jgi:hypothetical protein